MEVSNKASLDSPGNIRAFAPLRPVSKIDEYGASVDVRRDFPGPSETDSVDLECQIAEVYS
jgi:hypothetical protein